MRINKKISVFLGIIIKKFTFHKRLCNIPTFVFIEREIFHFLLKITRTVNDVGVPSVGVLYAGKKTSNVVLVLFISTCNSTE